jgi:hypothetical protein
MSFFERFTQRGGSTAPSVDDGVIFRTSPSAPGPIQIAPLPESSYPYAEYVRLDGRVDSVSPRDSTEPTSGPIANESGSGSKLTRFATQMSKSIGGFGRKRKGKKPQTAESFSRALEAEMKSLGEELRSSVNRQLMGDPYWHAIKKPKLRERIALKLHRKYGKHGGEWIHQPEHWYYEDCECCGQPVKNGWNEYWWRKCPTCGKFERVDKIPTTRKRRFRWPRRRN